VVDHAISITILTVGHSVFKVDPCSTPRSDVFTVNFALFGFGERGIGLEQGILEFLWCRVHRELLHNASGLSEGVRPDDKNPSVSPLSFHGVPPLGIRLLIGKVRVELPYDLLVAHQVSKVPPDRLTIIFSCDHEDQKSLVSRGHIEPLSETVKILQDRALFGRLGPEFFRDLLHRLDHAVVPPTSSWSSSLAQTLGGAAPRSR
jgi:hypothetical protein